MTFKNKDTSCRCMRRTSCFAEDVVYGLTMLGGSTYVRGQRTGEEGAMREVGVKGGKGDTTAGAWLI